MRLALFSIASVLIFVALLEALLRGLAGLDLLDLPPPPSVREQWASDGWRVDEDLHWAMLPNSNGRMGGRRYRTNSYGLRDQEIPREKPPGTYRILVLGDSTVFGFGVPFAKSFSEILESMLTQRSEGMRFDVINAGVPGYSLYNAFAYLRRDGFGFGPDLIVVESNFNDRRFVLSEDYQDGPEFYSKFYTRLRLREWLRPSYLYRALRRVLVAGLGLAQGEFPEEGHYAYARIDLGDLHCRVDPERYAAILEELIALARGRGVPVVLFPLPDSPTYVRDFRDARALAARGRLDQAIALLEVVDQRSVFYRIVVANAINGLLEAAGRSSEKIESIPAPTSWMTTDGSVFVSLGDPYVEIMKEAAKREGVWLVTLPATRGPSPKLYSDHVHLNEEGHRVMAERLFDLITGTEAIGLPR